MMANDSDIDSWDLKQDELVQLPHRNGYRLPPSKFHPTEQPRTLQDKGTGLPNGYSCYHKPRSSRSGPEVRFINPAIYAESFDNEEPIGPRHHHRQPVVTGRSILEASCGDSAFTDQLAALSINEQESSGVDYAGDQPADTYRCRSDTSPASSVTLTNNTKSVTRVVRRCSIGDQSNNHTKTLHAGHVLCEGAGESSRRIHHQVQRYAINGHRVVQFSTTSLSSSTISERRLNGVALARKIAHEEWVQKKQRAAQEKKDEVHRVECRRRMEREKIERERQERERREKENFLRWAERKKREEESRRKAVERELELQRRLKEVEDRAAMAKAIHLRQWARKKHEAQKAQQKEQQQKLKEVEEDRRKRLSESSKAYDKWWENSKNRPRPATQGLLPHQKAKPAYVNPRPWQRTIDETPAETQKDLTGRKVIGQPKNNIRKSIASHQ